MNIEILLRNIEAQCKRVNAADGCHGILQLIADYRLEGARVGFLDSMSDEKCREEFDKWVEKYSTKIECDWMQTIPSKYEDEDFYRGAFLGFYAGMNARSKPANKTKALTVEQIATLLINYPFDIHDRTNSCYNAAKAIHSAMPSESDHVAELTARIKILRNELREADEDERLTEEKHLLGISVTESVHNQKTKELKMIISTLIQQRDKLMEFAEEYARKNPKHQCPNHTEQDPNGVHALIQEIKATK
jgi:hypothetical protein